MGKENCYFENKCLSMPSFNNGDINVERTFHASHKNLSLRPAAGESRKS